VTALAQALEGLSGDDRRELERLLGVLVGGLAGTRLPALQVCRLCDRTACTSNGRECPLGHTTQVGESDG
jgi:hypothetical protein